MGYFGGINLYTYCSNNPVNWIDPFGLDKQKQKTYWDYYWEALWQQLNEPAVISNRYFEEFWLGALRNWNWYFDIGYSGFAPSHLHPGANVGLQIGSQGFNFCWGVGAGMGAGLTATFHPWQSLPSPGTKLNIVGRAGHGFGVKATGSVTQNGLSGRLGVGVGIGAGSSITATHTIRIFSWDWRERR